MVIMMLIIIGNNNLVITSIIKLFYHNSRVSNIWDRPWHWKKRSSETWKMSCIFFFSGATNVSIDNRYWLACNSVSPSRVLGLFIIGFHSKYAIINIYFSIEKFYLRRLKKNIYCSWQSLHCYLHNIQPIEKQKK